MFGFVSEKKEIYVHSWFSLTCRSDSSSSLLVSVTYSEGTNCFFWLQRFGFKERIRQRQIKIMVEYQWEAGTDGGGIEWIHISYLANIHRLLGTIGFIVDQSILFFYFYFKSVFPFSIFVWFVMKSVKRRFLVELVFYILQFSSLFIYRLHFLFDL